MFDFLVKGSNCTKIVGSVGENHRSILFNDWHLEVLRKVLDEWLIDPELLFSLVVSVKSERLCVILEGDI